MRRRIPAGDAIGIDLLLAGSDAFGSLADELAAEYARRHDAGDCPEVLEWARRMAEFAAWWCGRLEAEADYVAGFGEPDAEIGGRRGFATDLSRTSGERSNACRRRRRQPPH